MSKPRPVRGYSVPDRPELSVKMDYSDIYRENDVLDENLEDTLDDIHKNKYRTWVDKRHELKVIRQQVDVIMKLRAAVNTRPKSESIDLISNTRQRRPSVGFAMKQSSGEKKQKDLENIDAAEVAQGLKTQLRISQERERYSSKNLFNVRRKTSMGLSSNLNGTPGAGVSRVQDTTTSDNDRLFTKRSTSMNLFSSDGVNVDTLFDGDQHGSRFYEQRESQTSFSERPKTAHFGKYTTYDSNNNDNNTNGRQGSRKGKRPKTAIGFSGESTAVSRARGANRCRSRRELELLSRVNYAEETPKQEESEKPVREVINRSRRNEKLRQLRTQGHELQLRVDQFLGDLQTYNAKQTSKNSGNDILFGKEIF